VGKECEQSVVVAQIWKGEELDWQTKKEEERKRERGASTEPRTTDRKEERKKGEGKKGLTSHFAKGTKILKTF